MNTKNLITILSILVLIALLFLTYTNYYSKHKNVIEIKQQTSIISSKNDKLGPYDAPAIGNIYLGISPKEFKKQKRIFLSKNKLLFKLNINDIIAGYYNNKVEQIIIISNDYKFAYNYLLTSGSWENAYNEKYNKKFKNNHLIKNGLYYTIRDFIDKNDANNYIEYYFIKNKIYNNTNNDFDNIIKQAHDELVNTGVSQYDIEENMPHKVHNDKNIDKKINGFSFINIINLPLYNKLKNKAKMQEIKSNLNIRKKEINEYRKDMDLI